MHWRVVISWDFIISKNVKIRDLACLFKFNFFCKHFFVFPNLAQFCKMLIGVGGGFAIMMNGMQIL